MIRQLVHKLIGAGFWALMIVLWVLLFTQHKASSSAIFASVQYVAVVTGAVLAVTLWWISHNRRIYRRKGPRQAKPEMQPNVAEDRLGRTLEWHVAGGPVGALNVGHLVVELDGDVKTYRSG